MEDGILPTHSLTIYTSITDYGYNINEFHGDESKLILTIRHIPSGHHFVVKRSDEELEDYNGYLSTFTIKKTSRTFGKLNNTLGEVLLELKWWLKFVVKRANTELNTPNPWKKYNDTYKQAMSDESDKPFTETEAIAFKKQLDGIPQYVVKLLKVSADKKEATFNAIAEDIKVIKKFVDKEEAKGFLKVLLIGYVSEWMLDHTVGSIDYFELLFKIFEFLQVIPLPPHIN